MRVRFKTALMAVVVSALASSGVGAAVPGLWFTETGCDEYSDSVARLYTAGLGREPERGGFEAWMVEYTSGRWSLSAMATFFTESAEFDRSYGALSQEEFVRQLYRNVLGREGEDGGVAFWDEQMSAGMDRGTVLLRFAESPENIENSGTSQPALGPFNSGRSGPWSCDGWVPGRAEPQDGPVVEVVPEGPVGPGADLSDEVFRNADMANADLSFANMADALIFDSDFSGVDFTGARLTDLVVQRSDLSGANFTDANLTDALISGSTNLTGAIWDNTTCPDETNSDANGGRCNL